MATYSGTPRTWAAAETLTATLLNAEVRDPLAALSGAWTSYTPSLTGFTLGNGTVAGAYMRVNKLIAFRASLTFGTSTTPPSGAGGTISLPVTAATANGMVTARFAETGVNVFLAFAYLSTSAVSLYCPGTNGAAVNLNTSVPFAWGSTDVVYVAGLYEAA